MCIAVCLRSLLMCIAVCLGSLDRTHADAYVERFLGVSSSIRASNLEPPSSSLPRKMQNPSITLRER